MDEPLDEETWVEENNEGNVDGVEVSLDDSYDPLHPDLEVPAEFKDDYFFVLKYAIVYDEYIEYKDSHINTGNFSWDTFKGCNILTSLKWSNVILNLIEQAPRVTTITDHSESKSKQFASVTKIVDKPPFAHLGLVSHQTRPYTLATCRPSRFLHSLKQDTALRAVPFFICHQDNVSNPVKALSFASAPKFSQDSHKLLGLLSQHTKELPDSLRTKDFEARSHLKALLSPTKVRATRALSATRN